MRRVVSVLAFLAVLLPSLAWAQSMQRPVTLSGGSFTTMCAASATGELLFNKSNVCEGLGWMTADDATQVITITGLGGVVVKIDDAAMYPAVANTFSLGTAANPFALVRTRQLIVDGDGVSAGLEVCDTAGVNCATFSPAGLFTIPRTVIIPNTANSAIPVGLTAVGGQCVTAFSATTGAWTTGACSGAPTSAQYWVGAADGTLSAEKDLSGFTGLVLNTAGTPTAKAANTCTAQFPRSDNASGVWTCATVSLTADVTGVLPSANGGSGPREFSLGACGGATAINWANGEVQTCTSTTSNVTFGAPTNPVGGKRYAIVVKNSGHTVAWNAIYEWPSDVAPTASVSGKTDVFTFIYYSTDVKYFGATGFNYTP